MTRRTKNRISDKPAEVVGPTPMELAADKIWHGDWEYTKEQQDFLAKIDDNPKVWMLDTIFKAIHNGLSMYDFNHARLLFSKNRKK